MGWQPSSGENPPPRPARRPRARKVAAPEPTVIAPEPTAPRHLPPAGDRVDRRGQMIVKLGTRWSKIIAGVKAGEYTWQQFVEGLDPEELARGQLKDENGGWRGRPPALVPREFHLACQRELKRRFEELFSSSVLTIAEAYIKLAQSEDVPVQTRAKMLQYAMERIMGGIPKEFKVSAEAPYEAVLAYITSGDSDVPEWQQRRNAGYAERLGEGADDEPR